MRSPGGCGRLRNHGNGDHRSIRQGRVLGHLVARSEDKVAKVIASIRLSLEKALQRGKIEQDAVMPLWGVSLNHGLG